MTNLKPIPIPAECAWMGAFPVEYIDPIVGVETMGLQLRKLPVAAPFEYTIIDVFASDGRLLGRMHIHFNGTGVRARFTLVEGIPAWDALEVIR